MTPEQFTYWLKGFIEIENPKELDENKTQILKDHIDLVFNKLTPNRVNNEAMFCHDKATGRIEFKYKRSNKRI